MRYMPLIGRFFFTLIFLTSAFGHFSQEMFDYAASKGVSAPSLLVPLSGIIAITGALSVMFGYKTRWGAALLMLFLVPVTLQMHDFWNMADAQMQQIEQAMFMKNLSMLGAAMLIAYFGPGPLSLDGRGRYRYDISDEVRVTRRRRKQLATEPVNEPW